MLSNKDTKWLKVANIFFFIALFFFIIGSIDFKKEPVKTINQEIIIKTDSCLKNKMNHIIYNSMHPNDYISMGIGHNVSYSNSGSHSISFGYKSGYINDTIKIKIKYK